MCYSLKLVRFLNWLNQHTRNHHDLKFYTAKLFAISFKYILCTMLGLFCLLILYSKGTLSKHNDVVEDVTPVGLCSLGDPRSVGLHLKDVQVEKHSQSDPTEGDNHIDCCPLAG